MGPFGLVRLSSTSLTTNRSPRVAQGKSREKGDERWKREVGRGKWEEGPFGFAQGKSGKWNPSAWFDLVRLRLVRHAHHIALQVAHYKSLGSTGGY